LILLLLAMLLTMALVSYKAKHKCIRDVNSVNEEFEKFGLDKKCEKLQLNSAEECNAFEENSKMTSSEEYLDLQLDDCAQYIENTKVKHTSINEKDLPLAFSLIAHRDASQLSKLISAIFRPWNSYCLQLDSKADPKFIKLMTKLVQCYNTVYPNATIFLSERQISVVWEHISLLEGDLACLEQLEKRNSEWKYFVNVAGSEYPLITNHQLVEKLAAVKNRIGFVHSMFPWAGVESRWKYSHQLPDNTAQGTATSLFGGYYKYGPYKTDHLKAAPPFNLTIMVGVKNVAITREFAHFVLFSKTAKVVRDWFQDTIVAEEHFFATLATIQVDGDGNLRQEFHQLEQLNSFSMRKTLWHDKSRTCQGKVKREICNLAFGDLTHILEHNAFVMNKFDTKLDPTVVDCLRYSVYGIG